MTELAFVIPGRLDQLTGGYLYDRHVIDGLRSRGHAVKVIELGPKDHETALAELAEGTTAVIDGLAIPDIEQAVIAEWRRLRLVAVVHHPLAEETGLSRTTAERLVRLEAAALNRFRGVVCPSARTAAAVEAYGIPSDRIFVIPPGTAKPDRASRPRRGPVRSLLCVASVIPRKGHRVLVAALARLCDLDWQMLCIGSLDRDPRTAGLIRQMISAAGLGRRITLAGEQPPRMVMHAYRAADCFVLPSLHEGYGMAFAEAMAYGLPIIATAAGAIPETVPREAGLLVRPGDPAALARALRRVISEQALAVRLVAGSRAAGGRLPDWRQATERWEQALDLPGRRFPLKTETRNAISTHNVALLPVGREMMRVGRKILIVDDDGALRQSLAEQLELHEEFASVQCDSATGALQLASAERFDAILLDVGLPDMDGRELCRLLRRAGVQVPIIMLTGADSDADTVLGLDSGADDYVTKPFRLSVLLARLRAHLRQSEHSDDAVFTIGPYTFRPSAKLLLDASGRKKVRLTDKETAILKYLYRAGDHAIGRDTLLGEVWGYNAGVTTHTLETHVYRLRQKIERDPTRAEILVTEPGGYRLVP